MIFDFFGGYNISIFTPMFDLTNLLGIKHPIIMAPMFLVTNTKMIIEASKAGITGCIPALNFRTIPELQSAIKEIKEIIYQFIKTR